MVIIKPGMPYLDIIYRVKQEFKIPSICVSSLRRIFNDKGCYKKWTGLMKKR